MFDIANQLLKRHSSFAPLRLVDEQTAKPSPFPIQGLLSNFFGLWLLTFKLCKEGKKTKIRKKKKTETYIFSVVDNEISCGWKRKSSAKRFAIGRFWPWTWKISSVGKNQFNYWQFSILKIRPIICLCSNSTYVFILRAQTIVNGRLGEHSIGWKPLRFASWFPTLILCSPNLPRVYIRLCKHGNHFTFLHYCTAEVFFR